MKLFLSHGNGEAALALQLASVLRSHPSLRAQVVLSAELTSTEEAREHLAAADAVLVLLGKRPPATGDWREIEWRAVLEETWRRPTLGLLALPLPSAPLPRFLLGRERVPLGRAPLLAVERIAERLAATVSKCDDRLLHWLLGPAQSQELQAESSSLPASPAKDPRGGGWNRVRLWNRLKRSTAFSISILLHTALLWLLAQWIWREYQPPTRVALYLDPYEEPENIALDEFIAPEDLPPEPESPDTEPEDLELEEPEVTEDPLPMDAMDPLPAAFDALDLNSYAGLARGGGANNSGRGGNGKFRNRGGGGGHPGATRAVRAGLEWLARHQSDDGSWDSSGFSVHCGADRCPGPGQPDHSIGVTALALLAFLGDGHTTKRGAYREQVSRAVDHLVSLQDPVSGQIGSRTSHFMYCHSLATLALVEAHHLERSVALRPACQRAIDFLHHARDPYGVWRYRAPSNGEHDVSVTGWVLFALLAARDARLQVDGSALKRGMAYLEEMTDRQGRTGYVEPGIPLGFPASESTTAIAAFLRAFDNSRSATKPMQKKAVGLILDQPPHRNGQSIDLYYWYYASYALWQIGGRSWKQWEPALVDALLPRQRTKGHVRGSFDPVGCRYGHEGGRVYSTAMSILCLEVFERYAPPSVSTR